MAPRLFDATRSAGRALAAFAHWRIGAALLSSAVAVLLLGTAAVFTLGIGGSRPFALRHVAAAPAAPAVKEYTLVAQEVDWELYPGTTVKAWTYNGTIPGPEIRVTEGDTVRVTLKNQLPVPTTIHWHGVDVPNAMDGVPGMTQDAVAPGDTFTYEFVAKNPGTRWYHSHQDPEIQTTLGLFGPLIIEPRTPPAGVGPFDREYTYMLSEWSLALTPDVATGAATLPAEGAGATHSKEPDFDLFLMNGKANDGIPPLVVKQGQKVRVRLINAGSLLHVMHTHGHSFKVIALDGNPLPPSQQYVKDSVSIGPSERVDLELVADNPGTWMFHCHIEHHMANGMMTTIQYEGVSGGMGAAPPPPAAVSTPAAALPSAADVANVATKIMMVDNRYQPATITVPVGATVAWINNGSNVHTASSFNGTFESGSLPAGKAYTYTFKTPGEYQYLCRQHFLSGMSGKIIVQ